MLEPLNRRHLLDSLRPPADYDLDEAIGTTFSLDLMTLLTVPLAFALSDWEDDDGRPTGDPLALLEAIRQYADRTHIFCQAGGIYLPKGNKLFLSHLEGTVHEVVAPRKGGIFHPKVWILRFEPTYEGDPVIYRVLVLSRNLTFDRSWDTVLVLEGELRDRERVIRRSAPLGAFVAALPGMMTQRPTRQLRGVVKTLSHEIRRVQFDLPEGFEDMHLHPLGIAGTEEWWFSGRRQRTLTISPFLDPKVLSDLADEEDGDVLVSRLDQLQSLPAKAFESFREVYFLTPDANPEDDEEDPDAETNDETLSGLHAKVYVANDGRKGRIWTGSANATQAAMRKNVEFMVELIGKKSFCGVEAVLGVEGQKGMTRFQDMLSLYVPEENQGVDTSAQIEADRCKLQIRIALASSKLGVLVQEADGPDMYDVTLHVPAMSGVRGVSDLALKVWPVTVHEDTGKAITFSDGASVTFSGASFESLTTFYAFELRARFHDEEITDRFVLSVPVEGMPTDRGERVLRALLKNRGRVMQFLLFLLAENGDIGAHLAGRADGEGNGDNPVASVFAGTSLLEPLVNALHQDPQKLDRVARLVDELNASEDGKKLLPDRFMEVWEPIWAARKEIWK